MIRCYKLMDGNTSIDKVPYNNEQSEHNQDDNTDNIIQESKITKLKPQVIGESHPSLHRMMVLLNIKSENNLLQRETSIIKDNTYCPLSLSLNTDLYFL